MKKKSRFFYIHNLITTFRIRQPEINWLNRTLEIIDLYEVIFIYLSIAKALTTLSITYPISLFRREVYKWLGRIFWMYSWTPLPPSLFPSIYIPSLFLVISYLIILLSTYLIREDYKWLMQWAGYSKCIPQLHHPIPEPPPLSPESLLPSLFLVLFIYLIIFLSIYLLSTYLIREDCQWLTRIFWIYSWTPPPSITMTCPVPGTSAGEIV